MLRGRRAVVVQYFPSPDSSYLVHRTDTCYSCVPYGRRREAVFHFLGIGPLVRRSIGVAGQLSLITGSEKSGCSPPGCLHRLSSFPAGALVVVGQTQRAVFPSASKPLCWELQIVANERRRQAPVKGRQPSAAGRTHFLRLYSFLVLQSASELLDDQRPRSIRTLCT